MKRTFRAVRSNVAYKNRALVPQDKDVQELKVFVGELTICLQITFILLLLSCNHISI